MTKAQKQHINERHSNVPQKKGYTMDTEKLIRDIAAKHLAARWDNNPDWHGRLSKPQFIKLNLLHTMRNVRDGIVPKGDGTYKPLPKKEN